MRWFGLVLCLCVSTWLLDSPHLVAASARQCTTPVSAPQVAFTPPPVNYPSGSATASPTGCLSASAQTIICPHDGLLGDGMTSSGDLNTTNVFAWNNYVSLEYTVIPDTPTINLVNLYFYNEPSAKVGLPIITLNYDSVTEPVGYIILGNQDLSQSDSQYRSVSLAITSDLSDVSEYMWFIIRLSFQDTMLEWVLLSEIELCEDIVSIPTETIQFVDNDPKKISTDPMSSFSLSCTVTNQGSYNWEWSLGGNPFTPDSMWLSDTTRTSTISVTDSDSTIYQCRANSMIGTGVQNIFVNFQGPTNIQFADSEPRTISLGPDTVVSLQTLTCTVTQPQVEYMWQWRYNGNVFIPVDVTSPSDGTMTNSIAIPKLSADDAGIYQCQASSFLESRAQNITLILIGILETGGDVVYRQLQQSVNLTCELYGYLREGPPADISWLFRGEAIDSNLITTEQGTHMIQNGGDTPIPNLCSVLTLQNLTDDMFGTYICTIGNPDFDKTIELEIEPDTLPPPSAQFPLPAVIGGIAAFLAITILVVLTAAVAVKVWKLKKANDSYGPILPQSVGTDENPTYSH